MNRRNIFMLTITVVFILSSFAIQAQEARKKLYDPTSME